MSESTKIRFIKIPARFHLRDGGADQLLVDEPDEGGHAPEAQVGSLIEMLEQVTQTLVENEHRRSSMIAEIRKVALDLAVVIAGQLLFHEIDTNPEIMNEMFQRILGEVPLNQPCEIRVHPDLAKMLTECVSRMEDDCKRLINVVPDPVLEVGSCVVNEPGHEFICSLPLRMYELQQIMNEESHDAPIERRKNYFANQNVKRFPDRRATG